MYSCLNIFTTKEQKYNDVRGIGIPGISLLQSTNIENARPICQGKRHTIVLRHNGGWNLSFLLLKSNEVLTSLLPKPNFIASSGQISSQFIHTMHSLLSSKAEEEQTASHTPHEVHPSLIDLLRREYPERIPRNAP